MWPGGRSYIQVPAETPEVRMVRVAPDADIDNSGSGRMELQRWFGRE
jgi:hypothetical protein